MRLKYLDLQGFKSFPTKTRLQFDNGLTVVIGPNGSGKSNVADAIRWVFGEGSYKSMRGTSMQDVIFKGTAKRSPMTFAEVSLTFDNTIGTRLNVDTDEVVITRRYYRSGESEYQLNRQTVRKADISALFLNTGLGRSGYSMVNQGKTTEIISLKSDERRQIFEEAAGISGLRASKVEAERKLAEVDEHLMLVRLREEDLGRDLPSLARQAEKATQYLALAEQRKETDVSLWLYEVDSMRELLAQLTRDYASSREELQLSEQNITFLSNRVEELQERLLAGKLRVEEIHAARLAFADEKTQMSSTNAGLESDIKHAEEQLAVMQAEIAELRRELAEAETRGTTAAAALSAEEAALSTLTAEQSTLSDSELPAANAALSAAEDAVDNNVAAIAEMEDRIIQIELRLAAITSSDSSATELMEQMLRKKAELEAEIAAKRTALTGEEAAFADFSAREADMQTELAACTDTVARLDARHRDLTEEYNELRVKANTEKNTVASLVRMEELLVGYADGVRKVMEGAKNGKLSGIIAPVSKLFTTEQRYVIAIETAIGANIQNIVVEHEGAATDAIRYLKQVKARATFYPLTSIRPQYLNLHESRPNDYMGYLGVATEFVSTEARYEKIFAYLLGRTLVFDTIDHATVFSKATGYRTRIVTLDGQLINVGGSFTGGAARESGILTRSTNIADSEKMIADYEARMQQITAENESLLSDRDKATARRRELEEQLSILAPLLHGKEVQVRVARDTLARCEETLAAAETDLARASSQSSGYQTEILALNAEKEKLTADIATAKNAKSTLQAAANAARTARDAAEAKLQELKLQSAVKARDVETASTAHNEAVASFTALKQREMQYETRMQVANETIARSRAALEQNSANALSQDERAKALLAELAELQAANDRAETEQTTLRRDIDAKRDARESLIERSSKLGAKKEQTERELDKAAQDIAQMYHLTYGTALELGYPTVTADSYAGLKKLQSELHESMRKLGNVNTEAVDQYREKKEAHDAIVEQLTDMEAARAQTISMLADLEKTMSEQFLTTFHKINDHFGVVFERLFGEGGTARLSLSDPDDVLASGIDIHVAPPGKKISSLSLLSGGEQSCVAIAILFSILQVAPTPFCLLDEVEAALDEENVRRVAKYAKEYAETIQMIMISHRRGTMEEADVLYGVTMAEQGVTTVLSVRADEAEQKLGVKF